MQIERLANIFNIYLILFVSESVETKFNVTRLHIAIKEFEDRKHEVVAVAPAIK